MSSFGEVKHHLLQRLNSTPLENLRSPFDRRLYPAAEIVRMLSMKLSSEDYAYIQRASKLSIAALEASVELALDNRVHEARQHRRRRRRS